MSNFLEPHFLRIKKHQRQEHLKGVGVGVGGALILVAFFEGGVGIGRILRKVHVAQTQNWGAQKHRAQIFTGARSPAVNIFSVLWKT